ncbi:hypothetical protein FRC00_005338 [Tulasnella sp. 408]|nr:hypothetical protein FRC00_005338 [Tulasnella sp. 408]
MPKARGSTIRLLDPSTLPQHVRDSLFMSKFISGNKATPGEQPTVILRVRVVGCSNLLASDSTGQSDPYVIVSLHGERHRTTHVKQSLNPVYPTDMATFDFRISRSNVGDLGPLTFVIRDKDPFHDDYIGEAAILIHRWFNYDEPSPAFEFGNSQNTPFSIDITSSRKHIQAQGTIQLKIGFVPVHPTSPPDYAAIFSEFQQYAEMTGSTLHSSVPTRVADASAMGESEKEDYRFASVPEEAEDETEEGTTSAFATSRSTPISRASTVKHSRPPPIIPPTHSRFRTYSWRNSGFLPKGISPGPRSTTAGKEYHDVEITPTSEGSRPASRGGERNSGFKTKFEGNFNFSPNNDIVGMVMLEIQGAEHLPKWRNVAGTSFDMDPFCVVSFGKKTFSTHVVLHSLNPVWSRKLLLPVHQSETNLDIKFGVFDFDKFSGNDEVGSVSIALPKLMANVPRPDADTMLYAESVTSRDDDTAEHKLPITITGKKGHRGSNHVPVLKFRTKYLPYSALRQKLWRRCLSSYDTNGNGRISHSELTRMLGFLGSTLSREKINNFFTLFNVSPSRGDLPLDQVIIFLEDAVHRSTEQPKYVETDRQVPDTGGPTPRLTDSPKEDARILAPIVATETPDPASAPPDHAATLGETIPRVLAVNSHQGHNKPLQPPGKPDAMRSVTKQKVPKEDVAAATSNRQSAVHSVPLPPAPFPPTGLPNEHMHEKDRGSGSSSHSTVEHIININHCPVCNRLRIKPEEAEDIVTHLAVCPSSDWEVLNRPLLLEKHGSFRRIRKGSALRHSNTANWSDVAHAAKDTPVLQHSATV